MSTLGKYFKKAGGFVLVRQYWRNGVLGTAIAQFLLLGRDKTALELLRLSVDYKKKIRFKKNYESVLKDFDAKWSPNLPHQERKTIWIFWWQGEEAMPPLVKKCYASLKMHFASWEIVLLTEHNYQDFTAIPNYILDKLGSGVITLTHFSDLLRLELLIKNGGLWIDATVLCTSGDIPNSILKSDLFVYRPQKPGADGKATTMSSWFMWAKTNNRILMATQAMLYYYWRMKNCLDDYFLLHQIMSIVMDYYPEESKKIPPFCNSIPHILLLHLFDPYNEQYWNDLKQITSFHKLSYKLDKEDLAKKGTYYDIIIAQDI